MPIRAPYNFVPVADWVFEPPWAKLASHDVPFRNGLSGSVSFDLIATTPLLVSRGRGSPTDRDAEFFRLPDGVWAIPGASLRGMVRNVLEIATFARFRLVHDRKFAWRDLSDSHDGRAYRSRFVAETIENGQPTVSSAVHAGWMFCRDGRWQIEPCSYALVEQEDIVRLCKEVAGSAVNPAQASLDSLFPGGKGAVFKYRRVEAALGSLSINFEETVQKTRKERGKRRETFYLSFVQATKIKKGKKGQLVFSGQPSRKGRRPGEKHREFVFFDPEAASGKLRPLEDHVLAAFRDMLGDAMAGFGLEPLPAPEDWRERDDIDAWSFWRWRGDRVPVFYLTGNGKPDGDVVSIGMTQLFKIPHERSLYAAIPSAQLHLESGAWDFVETLFGFEGDETGRPPLKGRVDFATAPVRGSAAPVGPYEVVLMTPHPTFEPNYVQQDTDVPGGGKLRTGSSFKKIHHPGAKIRGWKRYPAQPEPWRTPAEAQAASRFRTILHPLPENTRFACTMRFHNLLPGELGALLWALTWGGDNSLRHRLGLGKPYGFGQCRVELTALDSIPNNPASARQRYDLNTSAEPARRYMDEFVRIMHEAYAAAKPGCAWAQSEQVVLLLAMANPSCYPASFAGAHAQGPYIGDFRAHDRVREVGEVLPAHPRTPDREAGA